MKKLALILALISAPARANEAKPTLWIMAVQLKGSALTVTYPTEAACREAAKMTSASMKKAAIGRADCLPVMQP